MKRAALWLQLGGLAVAGLAIVLLPLTVTVLTSGHRHGARASAPAGIVTTPIVVAPGAGRSRCVATRGYYGLAFEGGPVAGNTERIVARLHGAGAQATFLDRPGGAAARPDLVALQRTAGRAEVEPVAGLPDLAPAAWTLEAEAVVRRALAVGPGAILWLHEPAASVPAALPRILDGLRRRGLCPGRIVLQGAGSDAV